MPDTPPRADAQVDGPSSLTNFGVMQERVANFDRRFAELAASLEKTKVALDKATDAISSLGKPKWSLWLSTGALISLVTGGVWGLAISMAISPISDRVKSLELASTTIVPREMHIEKWAQAKEDMNRLENEISQRASKDDLNRMAFDLLQKIEKKR